MHESSENSVTGSGNLSAVSGPDGCELHGGFVTCRRGRAGEAANLTAESVTETNQTAASVSRAAIGGFPATPHSVDPISTAFVTIKPQKPKLGRVLERLQVHVEHNKTEMLKQMDRRSRRAVMPSSGTASSDTEKELEGYLPQYFTCTRTLIGMRCSKTKAQQHPVNVADAALREV
ncbi:unnamed protein product [Trypanosoma congolense IL3000]|uniref:WGS project CAEQ00000000 data, annotated contig 29 n=1 Tax=Trypanosoma congolense (strain IL3000) TaxID=1068625 RepID=F9WEN1_TRYCI|nr:unnamed protein product [Trypanosoma congolense IL3000]